jgi:8-oxo-dGTP pyrophosphatase MutT (NUDIX family)
MCSYGLLVFFPDRNGKICYHIAQRRDTYAYIQFIRGKLAFDKLPKYFSLMTIPEKERLKSASFEDLWIDLHNSDEKMNSNLYFDAQQLFSKYKSSGLIQRLCDETPSAEQLDWCIPKGRKKHPDEPGIICALREYREETNNNCWLDICDLDPLYDELTIENHTYKSLYFVAKTKYLTNRRLNFGGSLRPNTLTNETNDAVWAPVEKCEKLLHPRLFQIVKKVDEMLKQTSSSGVPFISLVNAATKFKDLTPSFNPVSSSTGSGGTTGSSPLGGSQRSPQIQPERVESILPTLTISNSTSLENTSTSACAGGDAKLTVSN